MIYAIVSDIHGNAWSLFSTVDPDGVNSRLRIQMNELLRTAHELKARGGNLLIIAGDILHTRGVIDPEVLNVVRKVIAEILAMGINIHAIPGNHDLKSKDTRELSSSIQNLEQLSLEGGTAFVIHNKPEMVQIGKNFFGFVPWHNTHEALLRELGELAKHPMAAQTSVFIHAGIDGVISGMPGSGLTDDVLGTFGFGHVFAGHYHNHVVMKHGVVSIGATTHHNWGDVDTRAGFLMVDTDKFHEVTFFDTQAPKFVDVSGLDELEMGMECKDNYVRFRGPAMTQEEINELRDQFHAWGALGTSIQVPTTVASVRPAAAAKGMTLDQSVANFVDTRKDIPVNVDPAALKKRALEVLDEARLVVEEA